MGDPKKTKKKYFTPRHPWIKERIDTEKELVREYAFKRKKEIYKLDSVLKKFKDQAKKLISTTTKQGEKEKQQLMKRLHKLGFISSEAALDDVLGLTIQDIMERRLQNLVFKKGLARTQAQARQFIVHQHIMINNKKITAPNYLVSQTEEDSLTFSPKSQYANPEHPERALPQEEKMPVRPGPTEEEKKELSSKSEKGLEKSGASPKAEKKPKKETKKKKPTKKKTEKKEEPKK